MDKKKMFLIGLTVLGIFVIIDSIWVLQNPPYGDEQIGYAMAATGIFIIVLVYSLAQNDRKSTQ